MNVKRIKVLILGASGLIGSGLFQYLSTQAGLEVVGTVRSKNLIELFPKRLRKNLLPGVDVTEGPKNDTLAAIPLNAYLPHYLAAHCKQEGVRLIHISSDCVFAGTKGRYQESDIPDATDIYGKSKALGEVDDGSALTLRTSTIGHELASAHGLVNWFLSQADQCCGFKKAVFSGVPTVELARIISDFVIPSPNLVGLYHVAGKPISKHDLLEMIASEYNKNIKIIPDNRFTIDRSLNGRKFSKAVGYKPPSWPKLIKMMHQSHQG